MARFWVVLLSLVCSLYYAAEASGMALMQAKTVLRAKANYATSNCHKPSSLKKKLLDLKKKDNVRRLDRAIRSGNLKTIRQYLPSRGYLFPNGSNAWFTALDHLQGKKLKDALKLLTADHEYPPLPKLPTLADPGVIEQRVYDYAKLPIYLSSVSNLGEYYLLNFEPIVFSIDLFFVKSEREQIKAYVDFFHKAKDFYQENRHPDERKGDAAKEARKHLRKMLHNNIVVAVGMLVPFLSSHELVLDEQTAKDHNLSDPLSPYAKILATLRAIETDADETDLVSSIRSDVKGLARKLILRIESVVTALMRHDSIRLFHENPYEAHLFLARSFSFSTLGILNFPQEHKIARRRLQKTIRRVRARDRMALINAR
ncbi:MAG TPA: hypothetical protein VEL47_05470 [Myxococcota bacterium]|nr:hypothetical protein [Myxococcota bacterium]